MKTYIDCIPCFMDQALRAGRIATDDEGKLKALLDYTGCMIKSIPMESTPPETGEMIYREVSRITRVADPYENMKKENIEEALLLYPELKEMVRASDNSLLTAIRLAIAGNVIDLGVNQEFDLLEDVQNILKQDFAIFHFREFTEALNKAKTILYLGDNAVESVFDKILIEELGKPVVYAVRETPVINDVTYEDAVESGIKEVAEIISSGTSAPGTILHTCNPAFLEKFHQADMIISKGQGNYEGLSTTDRPVFFLLKAKCSVIANDLNVKVNDIILKWKRDRDM